MLNPLTPGGEDAAGHLRDPSGPITATALAAAATTLSSSAP